MYSCVLETRRVRFHNIPVEQREDLVEARVTGQVGVVEVGVAAIAVANVRRNQGESRFVDILDAITVPVKEGLGIDLRLPLVQGKLTQIGCSAGEPDRRRQAVHELIVPLVEDSDSPIPIGKTS